MEYGYSYLMLAFAAALLLYAGLLAWTKDVGLIPRMWAVKLAKDEKKRYAVQMAKIVALVAAAPALSALVGFLSLPAAVAVLLLGMAVCLWLATKLIRRNESK